MMSGVGGTVALTPARSRRGTTEVKLVMLLYPLRFLSATLAMVTLAWASPAHCDSPLREDVDGRFTHDSWSTKEGLPQNTINAVVQTRDGYLWLATFAGLMRFDGVRFRVFEMATAEGLASNRILGLFEDREGRLWLGHEQNGVTVMDDGVFSAVDHPLLASTLVWAFAQDRSGGVWVASELGLFRIDGSGVTRYTTRDGLPSDRLTSLLVDRRGLLWVGTEGGLARFDDGTWTAFDTRHGLPSRDVQALREDRHGTLWIGTARGLARRQGERFAPLLTDRGTAMNVTCFVEDRNGRFWVGTYDGLLLLEKPTAASEARYRVLRPFADHFSGMMRSIFRDREGNLWVGTNTAGLSRLKTRRLRHYSSAEGLPGIAIAGIAPDGEGGIWLAPTCGPIYRFQAGHILAPARAGYGAIPLCVHSLLRARDGSLWVGGDGELTHLGAGTVRRWTTKDGLPRERVRALFEDSSGRLWAGTQGEGLVRLDPEGLRLFSTRDGLLDDDVAVIAEDRRGDLWIGSGGGLTRWSEGDVEHFTSADGLAGGMVRDVYEDADGVLWIGTYGGGLSRFEDGVFTNFTRDDGLYDNAVSRILEDELGRLWMLGNLGISCIARQVLNDYADGRGHTLQGVTFGAAEGMLEGAGRSQPAGWRTEDGRMWFPTIEGVAVVDAKNFRPNALPPPVVVERLLANGVEHELRESAVDVPPGHRDLHIEYTGLSFVAPEKVRFRYRLEGYSEDWVEVGSRRFAEFTNVPPGSYRFRALASNDDGVWNTSGASLEIRVVPFIYETVWFRSLLAVLAMLAGLVAFRLRTRAIRERNRRLQQDIAERRRAAVEREALIAELEGKNAELERFNYTVSHDLRSPLVTIKGFIGYLERDLAEGETARLLDNVRFIAGAADEMSHLLDDLLALSRVGRVVDPTDDVDLAAIAREAVELVQGPIRERGVEVEVDAGMPTVRGDRGRLREVFQNLVENAVKFMGGQAAPHVSIGARIEGSEVIGYVRDNGLGIAPEYHDNVFGLFNQLNPEIQGTGIGLALVRRIVEFHGGRIWVESDGTGRGSTFLFRLPVDGPGTSSGDEGRGSVSAGPGSTA